MSKELIIEGYLDMVRKKIRKAEGTDQFLDFLREALQDYFDNNPNCTEEDIEREFGSPEEVARNYINDNFKVDAKGMAKSKKHKSILLVIICFLLVAIIVYAIRFVIIRHEISQGYGVMGPVVIEEEDDQ